MEVDINIISAIKNVFIHGLCPGSCTTLLLQGKYNEAKLHAHSLLITEECVWNNHIEFVEKCVPSCIKGDQFNTWKGYKNMTYDEQTLHKMFIILSVTYNYYTYNWISEVESEYIK